MLQIQTQPPRLAMAGLLRLSTAGGSFGGTFAKHNVLGCEADPKQRSNDRKVSYGIWVWVTVSLCDKGMWQTWGTAEHWSEISSSSHMSHIYSEPLVNRQTKSTELISVVRGAGSRCIGSSPAGFRGEHQPQQPQQPQQKGSCDMWYVRIW